MATVPQMTGVVFAGLLTLAVGCTSLDADKKLEDSPKPPPPCEPCQLVISWQNHVVWAPDPTRGGVPGPGLAGRVYLFGPQVGTPLTGEGTLVVCLHDESRPDRPAVEAWSFDPTTLGRLCKRDVIGWGYTVFLPWGHYSADMTRIRLRCCFQSNKGTRVFFESPVTLSPENGVEYQPTQQAPPTGLPPLPVGPQQVNPVLPPPAQSQSQGPRLTPKG